MTEVYTTIINQTYCSTLAYVVYRLYDSGLRQKTFILISSPLLRISETSQAGFEPVQNLSSAFLLSEVLQ